MLEPLAGSPIADRGLIKLIKEPVLTPSFRLFGLAATLAMACNSPAHADSFTSSASSAGSASSGSVSDSLNGSSNSSTRDKRADNWTRAES